MIPAVVNMTGTKENREDTQTQFLQKSHSLQHRKNGHDSSDCGDRFSEALSKQLYAPPLMEAPTTRCTHVLYNHNTIPTAKKMRGAYILQRRLQRINIANTMREHRFQQYQKLKKNSPNFWVG
jgi:hypothetical protein